MKNATADHLQPRSKDGTEQRDNLCLACERCNKHRDNNGSANDKPLYGPWNWQAVWDVEHAKTTLRKEKPERVFCAWVRLSGEQFHCVGSGSMDAADKAVMVFRRKHSGEKIKSSVLPARQKPAIVAKRNVVLEVSCGFGKGRRG